MAREFNFDGIVGPTHNYSGLSYGNVASSSHRHQSSSPKRAALQGLAKMKFVADLGIGQCVLPPQRRPLLGFLGQLGFDHSDECVIAQVHKTDPVLLAAVFSASSMWTANAATISPSADTNDTRLHLTPANLTSTLHRSIEPPQTTRLLKAIFADDSEFCVHQPLPGAAALSDEGAANHTRLANQHHQSGLELFVFGRYATRTDRIAPSKYPARQTYEACRAIARRHGLNSDRTLFFQQTPAAIDAGVFHNDVISVGNQNVFLCHECAFVDQAECLKELREKYFEHCGRDLFIIEFAESEISIPDAVSSYLFNSQLLTCPDGKMTLVCPVESRENKNAFACTKRLLVEDNPVTRVEFLDLRQSMNNGGGPACLRLRVVLREQQQKKIHQGVILTEDLHRQLKDWIERHYRDQLMPDDLRDPNLVNEVNAAFSDLAGILDLPEDVF